MRNSLQLINSFIYLHYRNDREYRNEQSSTSLFNINQPRYVLYLFLIKSLLFSTYKNK